MPRVDPDGAGPASRTPPCLLHVVVQEGIVAGQNRAFAAEVARTAGRLAALPQPW